MEQTACGLMIAFESCLTFPTHAQMCNYHASNEGQTKNYYPIHENLLNVELTHWQLDQFLLSRPFSLVVRMFTQILHFQ